MSVYFALLVGRVLSLLWSCLIVLVVVYAVRHSV